MPSEKVLQIEIEVNKVLTGEYTKLGDYLRANWPDFIEEGESVVDTAIEILEYYNRQDWERVLWRD